MLVDQNRFDTVDDDAINRIHAALESGDDDSLLDAAVELSWQVDCQFGHALRLWLHTRDYGGLRAALSCAPRRPTALLGVK